MSTPNQEPHIEHFAKAAGVGDEVLQVVGRVGLMPVLNPKTGEPEYGTRDSDGNFIPFSESQIRALDEVDRIIHLGSVPAHRPARLETEDIGRKYGRRETAGGVIGTNAVSSVIRL